MPKRVHILTTGSGGSRKYHWEFAIEKWQQWIKLAILSPFSSLHLTKKSGMIYLASNNSRTKILEIPHPKRPTQSIPVPVVELAGGKQNYTSAPRTVRRSSNPIPVVRECMKCGTAQKTPQNEACHTPPWTKWTLVSNPTCTVCRLLPPSEDP